jgi:hypothetical protein
MAFRNPNLRIRFFALGLAILFGGLNVLLGWRQKSNQTEFASSQSEMELANLKNKDPSIPVKAKIDPPTFVDLKKCLNPSQKKGEEILPEQRNIMSSAISSSREQMIPIFSEIFRAPKFQSLRWSEWVIGLPDGTAKKLRLENIETDEGREGRELHAYIKAAGGEWLPIEILEKYSNNPSDELINEWLREGEVIEVRRAELYYFDSEIWLEVISNQTEIENLDLSTAIKRFSCSFEKRIATCQCL